MGQECGDGAIGQVCGDGRVRMSVETGKFFFYWESIFKTHEQFFYLIMYFRISSNFFMLLQNLFTWVREIIFSRHVFQKKIQRSVCNENNFFCLFLDIRISAEFKHGKGSNVFCHFFNRMGAWER